MKRWLPALAAAAVLLALAAQGSLGSGEADRRLCLTVLDVGQGDALLVSLPGGQSWLVDGGGRPGASGAVGRYRVLPALRRAGVERLARVFASHGDLDHADGLVPVLMELPVGELWVASRKRPTATLRAVLEAAERRAVPVRAADEEPGLGDLDAVLEASLLQPWPGWLDEEAGHRPAENDRSLVLHLGLGRVSFLLTGDIEAEGEQRLLQSGRLRRATVLKVPHHASRSSSGRPFVEGVDPLVALAGIGADNRFGFPHASVAARYLTRGVPLYWTGRHGALRACTDGWELRVEQSVAGGVWQPLRSWSAEQLAQWGADGESKPVQRLRCPGPLARPRAARRSRRQPRGKPEPLSPAVAPADAPGPPLLVEEREWERRRRRRGRLSSGR